MGAEGLNSRKGREDGPTFARKSIGDRIPMERGMIPYYSVEVAIEGLRFAYQFKIWKMERTSMFVLVKENSAILPRLRVGDTYDMKYYLPNCASTPEQKGTAIRHITKDEVGRFRGHFLVGLEIVDGYRRRTIH
jgi:hypothetical protein